MVYKTCSVKKVLAQIYRDFKPSHSGWDMDAIEWIGDAIEKIGVNQGYSEQHVEINVLDHRAKMPCEVEGLLLITYKGMRLPRNGGLAHPRNVGGFNFDSPIQQVCKTDYYSLNPNHIKTSFREGCIKVYYLGLELDCDGYPFVVDQMDYREALTWYVLMKLIGRGFKHQTFDYKSAMSMWQASLPKAQNACKMPDLDQMENFKKNWNGLAKSVNRADEFFNTDGNVFDQRSFPPGDLLQTFQIIGPNEENPPG